MILALKAVILQQTEKTEKYGYHEAKKDREAASARNK